MAYHKLTELPDSVRDNLPGPAQEIYRDSFNHAFEAHRDPSSRRRNLGREEAAHLVAWSAVQHEYEKDKKTGHWSKR